MTATFAEPPPRSDLAAGSRRAPYRLAVAMVACTILLITLGGMVTSTGSGMAFRDWPLANGSLWPADMDLAGFFEHVHRAAGALVGLLILILTIWLGVKERRKPWLRRLMISALGLVVLQGVVGGIGVRLDLPHVTSIAHGVLAQVTLCTLTLVAFVLSPAWSRRVAVAPARVRGGRKVTAVAVSVIFAQLFFGAVARHTGSELVLWTHVGFAFVVFLVGVIAAGYSAGRLEAVPGVGRASRWVTVALLLQLALGFVALIVRTGKDPANVQFLWRSSLITAHVLVGALLFMATALLAFRVWRNAVAAPIPRGAG